MKVYEHLHQNVLFIYFLVLKLEKADLNNRAHSWPCTCKFFNISRLFVFDVKFYTAAG